MIVAYIRISTKKQSLQRQKYLISKYVKSQSLKIDKWISLNISSREDFSKRKIDELLGTLKEGDTLISTELSRLGRHIIENLNIAYELHSKKVNVIFTTQQYLSMFADKEMKAWDYIRLAWEAGKDQEERDGHSLKTKAALAARKAAGFTLGKPVGTIQPSKYDDDKKRILRLLKEGKTTTKIIKLLGYGSEPGLRYYLKKRGYLYINKE